MSANRPRDTKPELLLRKALYQAGHRGYRINYRISYLKSQTSALRSRISAARSPLQNPRSSVRPDITFVGKKIAIFVHGCYWHRVSVART